MRAKYKTHLILGTIWLLITPVFSPKANLWANEDSKYLDAVREFADNVLKYGRDTYGPKHTPLFVDGLNVNTHEPVKWIAPNGDRWILSNLASQQNLFRTLDGLTRITGDPKYKQAAMEAIEYAFENLRSPNGLLYWGATAAYDAQGDEPFGHNTHVFKAFYPYYELMWQVDPEATREIIESLWASHIQDWSNLEMDRIAPLDQLRVPKGWEHKYKGGPVFFKSWKHSFSTTGCDLSYAAAILSKVSGQEEPLTWGKRLAHRYIQTRDPKTGISTYEYNLPMDASQHPLADDFKGYTVYDHTIFPPAIEQILDPIVRKCKIGFFTVSPGIPYSFVCYQWTCYLLIGELLGVDGKEFIQWALEESTAHGKVAYRKTDNVWIPMLLDGTSLEGYAYKKNEVYGPKGTVFKPISAVPMDFWGYALAYRATEDGFMWEMARNLAQGNDLGDIGLTTENEPKLKIPTGHFDPYTLLALLELYKKTEKTEFLQAAQEVGDNILTSRFHKRFFTPSRKHIYTKFDTIEALALLHLDAAMYKKELLVPQVWPGRPFLNLAFRDKGIVVDNALIYTLTESKDPSRSLQEVSACGNAEEVKSLIAQGVDVNDKEGIFLETPLYRAVLNGHKEVVDLLLTKGAQVDARDAFPSATALGYAAEKGHKEIAELLIAHGADVNAKRRGYPAGDTPLHSAVRAGHKDIIELLIANVADVNIKNSQGQTPLNIALTNNRSDIVELLVSKNTDVSLHAAVLVGDLAKVKSLIEKEADINAKDASSNTPLHYAVKRRNKDIAELLITNGADVNAKNGSGDTCLHFIAKSPIPRIRILFGGFSWEGIVKSLINNGADVNMGDSEGRTPLWWALERHNGTVIELLRKHGAGVDKTVGSVPEEERPSEPNDIVLK